VVNQNKKNLLENWLNEDKIECSEELGDLVRGEALFTLRTPHAECLGIEPFVDYFLILVTVASLLSLLATQLSPANWVLTVQTVHRDMAIKIYIKCRATVASCFHCSQLVATCQLGVRCAIPADCGWGLGPQDLIKCRATPKVIASFAEKGEFDKILIYSRAGEPSMLEEGT